MKKTNLIAITLLVALFASLVGCSSAPEPPDVLILEDIYPTINFIWIEITNNDRYTKVCAIKESDEVLLHLGSIQFSKDLKFKKQHTVLYEIKFVYNYKVRKTMYILGDDSIVYDGYIYKASDDSIDLEYLAAIFE